MSTTPNDPADASPDPGIPQPPTAPGVDASFPPASADATIPAAPATGQPASDTTGWAYPQQPGAAYPQQPGAAYPQQPGAYPQGPGGAAYPPQSGPALPTPTAGGRAKAAGKTFLMRMVGFGVILLIGAAWAFFKSSGATAPQAGECIHHKGGNEIEVVKCTDANVDFVVLGVVGNQTETQFQADESCNAYPDATASYFEGSGSGTKSGYVLCLGPKK